MKGSDNLYKLQRHYEGIHDGDLTKIRLQPKRDPVGIWTVGWGHALFKPDGTPIRDFADIEKYFPKFLDMDLAMADEILVKDDFRFENGVNSLGLKLVQGQFDSLVDFSFNEGLGALEGSTLLKRIKGIVSTPDIASCFAMWNKGDINGDGKLEILPGLTFRRKSDALLYTTGELQLFN